MSFFSGVSFRWQDVIDIAIVAFIIYHILRSFAGTRAMQLAKGIFYFSILIMVTGWAASYFDFKLIRWIGGHVLTLFVTAVAVVFQPEMRRILEALGRGTFSSRGRADSTRAKQRADALAHAVRYFQAHKIGALIVLQREDATGEYWKNATIIDCEITEAMIESIFWPGGPLHDGATVLNTTSVIAAACYLPLSDAPDISRWYGTRHRAAVGITEVTDAIALIVSEETGKVTMANNGKMSRPLGEEQLVKILSWYFRHKKDEDEDLSFRAIFRSAMQGDASSGA